MFRLYLTETFALSILQHWHLEEYENRATCNK